MDKGTLVVVWAFESGPQGSGRPVTLDSEDIGVAETWDEVDQLLARAGVTADTDVIFRGDEPDYWG
jgi:hypothetical protein